ncbi:hypothetical protein [Ramlibacter sp.]|uniref:hypothetical protein n=1 Tax=Ramlibacter sp. TaxID=1917967 RepID=UPI002C422C5B|nr:hypothetical protein [Ramlibacter sp.]HWI82311.1 hypothetical protein [Ramlibacter sp.]
MSTTLAGGLRVAVLLAAAWAAQNAAAQDVTVVGPVTKIELAADGASAVATLKDGKSGAEVKLNVTDELTLDKFKDKRIVEGDEIRARFQQSGGGNASKSFRKTAGC